MKLQQSYINQTRENKAKPNSDYDKFFKQSKRLSVVSSENKTGN